MKSEFKISSSFKTEGQEQQPQKIKRPEVEVFKKPKHFVIRKSAKGRVKSFDSGENSGQMDNSFQKKAINK